MATSFAAYASQYLNRQNAPGTASLSSSQPMFFSFSTDEGSRAGLHHGADSELDDMDDPHLRNSANERDYHPQQAGRGHTHQHEDDEDPYLRLDEDGRNNLESQSIPLIASEHGGSSSSGSPKGWLAHLAASPSPHPMGRPRSPSPSPSESTDSGPPPDLFAPPPPTRHHAVPPPPPRTTQPQSLSLTESLLPRDGRARPLDVFSLPDPRHVPRSRRKYNDSIWTALWLFGVSICVFFSILLIFLKHKPKGKDGPPRFVLPYTTLLHTVPMLTILTFLSAGAAYAHVFLLRIFVRPVMIATEVFVPATLFISAVWAFVGSFMWDSDQEPTWGESVGLRLFSLLPLVLSLITAHRLLHLPRTLHTTSSTLTLTTHILLQHPPLLLLSPCLLLLMLICSIPFVTLLFRLLLFGYTVGPHAGSARWEWHLYWWANWGIIGTLAVWVWSWGVARGIMRVVCAGVVGSWYYADPAAPPPPPTSTHAIHAALVRASGPSLGTAVLSALILTALRFLTLLTIFLHRLPIYLPARFIATAPFVINAARMGAGYLEGVTTALSKYALVYAGLTGDAFMQSARRGRALTAAVEGKVAQGRRGRSAAPIGAREPPLTLLTIAPLTLTFPFALTTYLFVAHTLDAPQQALGAAMLAGGVTALVGLFCVGLVKDAADTLYICYCIDKFAGERRREEVFVAFEYDTPAPSNAQRPPQQQYGQQRGQQQQHREPERIVPLSPRAPSMQFQGRQFSPPQVPPQRQQQHQRTPSFPSTRQPQQPPLQLQQPRHQLAPSASVAHQMQRPAPLSPALQRERERERAEDRRVEPVEEEVDPFKQSFDEEGLESGLMHGRSPLSSGLESGMRSPGLTTGGIRSPASAGMRSSREMNMKNPRDMVDSDSDSEDGRGGESSQFFPGSGFF
ncbi:plasma-membrane choline transporter-domain-containing protein [Crucibulum laeve]|uniref:Plasma-membrane choline transporter-domain-containing protein n=1 Tax=Crucibulum laeve TaxID=68775 RepID=A0A5C3LTE0_9AGAR|nr:plasma-membrane choline transporter-domain-containing protein [Crucibulum laeve]